MSIESSINVEICQKRTFMRDLILKIQFLFLLENILSAVKQGKRGETENEEYIKISD